MNCFGIVPAAGRGLRMGSQHKLLLPWHNVTVIDQVLRAWTGSMAEHVTVIVRRDDFQLQKACHLWPDCDLVVPPDDPPDMKRSVQLGLQHIAATYSPDAGDRWMVAPADLPTLSSELIDRMVSASRNTDAILVPRFGDRRGHPVSFPWSMMSEVFELGTEQGINSLLTDHRVQWLDLPAMEHPDDMDTPQEYQRLLKKQTPP